MEPSDITSSRISMFLEFRCSTRVLHLNSRNMLIRDEVMSEGSIDQAAVYVREVIRRAIDLGSVAIILVHNHPSGDPSPSRADIQLTMVSWMSARLGEGSPDG